MKTLGIVLPEGLTAITNSELKDTKGFMAAQKHLDARKPNKMGKVGHWMAGHGGDGYPIYHEDGTVGVYWFDEFELTLPSLVYYKLYYQFYRIKWKIKDLWNPNWRQDQWRIK